MTTSATASRLQSHKGLSGIQQPRVRGWDRGLLDGRGVVEFRRRQSTHEGNMLKNIILKKFYCIRFTRFPEISCLISLSPLVLSSDFRFLEEFLTLIYFDTKTKQKTVPGGWEGLEINEI